MTAQFTRRAALGCAIASVPAIAGAVALPMPLDEQEIARLIAAYREAERNYNEAADAPDGLAFGSPESNIREARIEAAFAVWSDVFKDLLASPCRSFRAVQMKTEVLLSDKTGAFGQGMEYHESVLLLRSFMEVQS